jgi:hypothetical protein
VFVLLSAGFVLVAAVLLVVQFLEGGNFGLVYTAIGLAVVSMVLLQLARWMGSRPEGATRSAPEPLTEMVAAMGPAAVARVEAGGRGSSRPGDGDLLWAPAPPSPTEISAGTPVYDDDPPAEPTDADLGADEAAAVVDERPPLPPPPPAPRLPAPPAAAAPPAGSGEPMGGGATVRTFLGRRRGALEIELDGERWGAGPGR